MIQALLRTHPDHRIVLTHMTPTGRDTRIDVAKDALVRCYLPYDFPRAVARFLDHFQPRVGVLMETEIWPNLIHACSARGVPLYLVNARLSEKSWTRYRRFSALARASLGQLAGIVAQGEHDAQRLRDLGAPEVSIAGNLKFDVAVPPEQLELGLSWRSRWGERPVLLAASTREGEEVLLLDALQMLDVPQLLFVIVPRHPQRFDEVAALIEQRGLRLQRRSAGVGVDQRTQVLLGDSMGEMFAYYAACDVAFIGGSLRPYGAQNVIEACAAGKAVLVGPSTYNFVEAAAGAVAAGAALQVKDADELMRAAKRLLLERDTALQMGTAGLAFCRAHQGATERILRSLRW
jgi:3-deoxy-D-manno-octulosonic-acid transferase